MTGPHDPDHAGSAGLALRAEAEETGNSAATKEAKIVKDSRTPRRFWLVMATLIPGLAVLAIGFIFFSTLPGALAAETMGAGLALLAVCILLLTGVWGPVKGAQTANALAVATTAAPDRLAEPSPPAAPASSGIVPEALPPTAPAITAPASSVDDLALLDAAPAPETGAPGAEQGRASVAEAVLDAIPAPPAPLHATPEPEPAPAAEPPPARETPKRPTSQTKQNGHAAPAVPRTRASRTPADDDAPPSPPPLNLAQRFPPYAGSAQLDFEAEGLSTLLGDVAEQAVTAVVTPGKPGVEHRTRLAEKIDAFRRDLALDPNYAPIAAFLEAMVALLRAGKPIPASALLVDPFDGLYEYVLTLIERKTRGS